MILCDTCKHSQVCFGKSLYRQFKDEVDGVGNKYIEKTKDALITSFEEWFKVDVRCKHYLSGVLIERNEQ